MLLRDLHPVRHENTQLNLALSFGAIPAIGVVVCRRQLWSGRSAIVRDPSATGARAGGKPIAFIHPKSTTGILIELTE